MKSSIVIEVNTANGLNVKLIFEDQFFGSVDGVSADRVANDVENYFLGVNSTMALQNNLESFARNNQYSYFGTRLSEIHASGVLVSGQGTNARVGLILKL